MNRLTARDIKWWPFPRQPHRAIDRATEFGFPAPNEQHSRLAESSQNNETRREATEMNLNRLDDRFDHPLRLAKGSHQPGSGTGCAKNVISHINGHHGTRRVGIAGMAVLAV